MKKVFLLVMLAGAAVPSIGQRVLTFEEAVKIAMANAVLLNQQKNNLELSQMQKLSSIAGVAPSITLNTSASQINGNSFNPNVGAVVNGIRDNVTGSINANLNVFSGFARINSIRQFSSLLEAQSYFVKRTAQDVINTVSTQYLNVMLDVELSKIAKENFEALAKQYQQVVEQVKIGSRSPVEEYNQDAVQKGAELRYVQAEIQLGNDKALLAQTLLMDPFEEFNVEEPKWDVNSVGNEVLNSEELANRAKESRGDYLRAVKNEEAQKFGMRVYKGFMMPSITAFGSYGSAYNYQHGVPDSVSQYSTELVVVPQATAPTGYGVQGVTTSTVISNPQTPRPFSEQFRKNNTSVQYGLQLSFPLFNGLQNRTNYVQQKVLYENNKLARQNLEFQIRNDIVRAVRNYEGAKKAFAVTVDQLKAAEMAFGLEKERYELGVTDFVAYSNANKVLVQSQTDKAQAEYRLVFQKILLEYATGTLKPEDVGH